MSDLTPVAHVALSGGSFYVYEGVAKLDKAAGLYPADCGFDSHHPHNHAGNGRIMK